MKKTAVLFMTIILCMLITACVRVGEKDSTDFLAEMSRRGYRCNVEETESGNLLKESCYIDNYKLSMFSDDNGQLISVSLTYSENDNVGFESVAADVVGAFCGFDSEQINSVFSELGNGGKLHCVSSGVRRCDTQWYGFSFTCDEVGGALAVESFRLNPTSAPEVTINTTVPFVSFASSEESSS